MHSLKQTKGLTLVELMITTAIVGVIMLGMVSVDYALRGSEQQQSRAAIVALKTSAAMLDMTSTLSRAIGWNSGGRCVVSLNMNLDNFNFVCAYTSPTANDPTDDTWICYTRRGTDLHRCQIPRVNGPTDCTSANVIAGSDKIIGTVTTDGFQFVPFVNANTRDFYYEITLSNRYNPGAATYAANVAQEYLNNPKYQLVSRVTPVGCTP